MWGERGCEASPYPDSMETVIGQRPEKIDYEGLRGISAKLIYDYILNDSEQAAKDIEHQDFFTKANDWKYESEWRLVSPVSGSHPISFELTGVYFGIRCNDFIIASIMKLLFNNDSCIDFYKMKPDPASFELHFRCLDPMDFISNIPKRSPKLIFSEIRQ